MNLKTEILHKENWNLLNQKQKNDLSYFLKDGNGFDNIQDHHNIVLMALYIAIRRKKINQVDIIVDSLSNSDVEKIKPEHINQILNGAMQTQNEDLINNLVKKFKKRIKHDNMAIVWSVKFGFLKLTETLLDTSNKENINNSLCLAVEMGSVDMVRVILSCKEGLDIANATKNSLIDNHFPIAQILIDEIVKRESKYKQKNTFTNILWKICYYNDKKDAVDLLFDLVDHQNFWMEKDSFIDKETNTFKYIIERIKIKNSKNELDRQIKNKTTHNIKHNKKLF